MSAATLYDEACSCIHGRSRTRGVVLRGDAMPYRDPARRAGLRVRSIGKLRIIYDALDQYRPDEETPEFTEQLTELQIAIEALLPPENMFEAEEEFSW